MEEEVHRVTIRISKVFQDTLTLDTHSKSWKIFTTNIMTCNTVDIQGPIDVWCLKNAKPVMRFVLRKMGKVARMTTNQVKRKARRLMNVTMIVMDGLTKTAG